ncbi:hypothetical protein MSAN_00703300 [Mycena sanguinolenta]|uniref:Uncharacterized protein n=1 Tax=Mycena sanguinolenta TaxID=230812 RepID=A0A8H6Z6G7_9AGAR|nr:hypothetical protein MSAN_00703300 [Mycena sanguinolenta]
MPYPSPLVTELNLLFEPRKPRPSNVRKCTPPPTTDRAVDSPVSSPASSTATLTLEDDEIQSIFSSEKYPGSAPSTPREELNPLAAPFFPRSPPVKAVVPPPRLTKPAQPPATRPVWLDAFTRGACTSATPEHHSLATAVVASRRWPIEAMAELAQHFCSRGSEKITDESAGIAPFAFMVYRKFFDIYGEEVAQSFIWHLREAVVGAFKACWDPDYANAISYADPPSFNYVASAIAQATFVGQLFKASTHMNTSKPCAPLISTAGASFWHGPGAPGKGNIAIHQFVATFLAAVAPLRWNMSVLGRFLKANDMRDIIAEVETLVSGWVYDPARGMYEIDAKVETQWPKLTSPTGKQRR